jgi:hypothetical protein
MNEYISHVFIFQKKKERIFFSCFLFSKKKEEKKEIKKFKL